MKFNDKYLNALLNFQPRAESIFKCGELKCWHCGTQTTWIDYCFEAGLCSEECYGAKWQEYQEASHQDCKLMNFPLAQITDYEALKKISFEQVESYLLKKGWKMIAVKTQQASAWKSPDKSTGVLVPKTREVADYSYRIGDCIGALAAYEKRSQINIWLEITND